MEEEGREEAFCPFSLLDPISLIALFLSISPDALSLSLSLFRCLLKPTDHMGDEVLVTGFAFGGMSEVRGMEGLGR